MALIVAAVFGTIAFFGLSIFTVAVQHGEALHWFFWAIALASRFCPSDRICPHSLGARISRFSIELVAAFPRFGAFRAPSAGQGVAFFEGTPR